MTNPLAHDLPEPPNMLPTALDIKIHRFLKIFVPKNIKNLENQKFFNDPIIDSGCFRAAEHV